MQSFDIECITIRVKFRHILKTLLFFQACVFSSFALLWSAAGSIPFRPGHCEKKTTQDERLIYAACHPLL